MQSVRTIFAGAVFFFFLFTVSCYAADIKIGVVNIQKVVEESSAGKMAQAEIKKEGKRLDDELKRRGSEIESLRKKLDREAAVMSREQREKKERELDIKVYDFKTLDKKYKEQFMRFQNERLDRMRKDILEVVEEIGKREGYHLIIQKLGVALYYDNVVDITDKLIRRYNEKF